MRRGSLQSKWMAATGCLAALALGVAACGSSDNNSSSSSSGSGSGSSAARPSRSIRRSRSRAHRACRRRPSTTAPSSRWSSRTTRPATTSRSSTSRSTTRRPRPATGLLKRSRGTPARRRRTSRPRRLPRQFNSGAAAIAIPILNEAGVPMISPGEHGRGPDHEPAGLQARRAGQVLPDRQAQLHAHRPEGHDPGRGARDADEAGRLHQGADDQRQGGLRRGPRQEHRARRQGASA